MRRSMTSEGRCALSMTLSKRSMAQARDYGAKPLQRSQSGLPLTRKSTDPFRSARSRPCANSFLAQAHGRLVTKRRRGAPSQRLPRGRPSGRLRDDKNHEQGAVLDAIPVPNRSTVMARHEAQTSVFPPLLLIGLSRRIDSPTPRGGETGAAVIEGR